MQAYLDYMVDVATFMGADPDFARKEMTDVLEFEMQLANFSLPREERRNASRLYNPRRIRDLSSLDPHTPWLDYINNILTDSIMQVRPKYNNDNFCHAASTLIVYPKSVSTKIRIF